MLADRTVARFINECEKYLGTHENPIGAGLNNSPVNKEYGASGPAWPWCAMTMWLAATHAGFSLPKTASVYQMRTWAQSGQHGLKFIPVGQQLPGDIFIYTRDRHTGMFNYNEAAGFLSVEGNWGDACVRVKRSSFGDIAGFVRLPFEQPAVIAPPPPPPAPPASPVPATKVAIPGTLRKGDQGLEVWLVQIRLNTLRQVILLAHGEAWGPDGPDGYFGDKMQLNVSAFQRKAGAAWEVGVWGPQSQACMSRLEAALGIHH